ncbi:MAG: hypothetical protein IJ131_06985, partial [Eggerthellaceae bacterium]|nr:hypothetical protein [Eggerthellaceae bacterium]
MLFQNHLHVRRAIHVVASLSLVCSLCLPPAAAAADDPARTGQPAAGSPQVTAFSLSESAEGQESAQPATQADTLPDVVSIQSNASTTTAEVAIDWGKTDNADAATVTATLSYQGTVMRTVTANFERTSGEASETFTMDFENYGKFEVKVQFKKGGALVGDAVSTTAAIYADTYNIAPVSATLPVTFFSLNLWGEGNIRESGPVILLMERPSAYNWDALPSGMYGLPYLSTEDLTTQPDVAQAGWTFIGREEIMADYVHDLLAMNPDSQINLYCVDVYTDLIQRIIYANQIPQDQYRIVVISDGSATYASFEKSYKRNGKTPSQNHADFVKRWTDDKEYASAIGKA